MGGTPRRPDPAIATKDACRRNCNSSNTSCKRPSFDLKWNIRMRALVPSAAAIGRREALAIPCSSRYSSAALLQCFFRSRMIRSLHVTVVSVNLFARAAKESLHVDRKDPSRSWRRPTHQCAGYSPSRAWRHRGDRRAPDAVAAPTLSCGEPVRTSPARSGVLGDDRAVDGLRTSRRAEAATLYRPREAGLEEPRLGRRRSGTDDRGLGRPLPGDPPGAGHVDGGEADSPDKGAPAVVS